MPPPPLPPRKKFPSHIILYAPHSKPCCAVLEVSLYLGKVSMYFFQQQQQQEQSYLYSHTCLKQKKVQKLKEIIKSKIGVLAAWNNHKG